jgi:molybdenum cofactor cytidylyltransferase
MTTRDSLCGIVILAAGNSSRLGEPKQLIRFNNKSLLRHVSEEALEVSHAVIVVTGAFEDTILNELTGLPVYSAHNPDWSMGMGGSLATGLKHLTTLFPLLTGVIICVSDQPHISRDILCTLRGEARVSGKGIVACSYDDSFGTPVFFRDIYFDELLNLPAKAGAKMLISRHKNDVTTVSFPLGHIDIDTRADYELLKRG